MKLDAFKSLRESKNLNNFNDLLSFVYTHFENDHDHGEFKEFDEFKSLQIDDMDKKYITKDLMGFTNVFVTDLKDKVFNFAKEEMDKDTHSEITQSTDTKNYNDRETDIVKLVHDQHITRTQSESYLIFKQRVLNLYHKSHPHTSSFKTKFPSEYAGDNKNFFGPDPTDLITFLNPTTFPDIITKKTRMMMRHWELFFNTLTLQMKIMNGISQS